jgi:hypothetical protein
MAKLIVPVLAAVALAAAPASAAIDPGALPAIGTVDPRFQSYNVEMVEVTGGRFWKPYRLGPPKDAADRYAYRPPIDLANPRLVKLARALGPAYVRVSGTWANNSWFAAGEDAPKAPPPGFQQVLTRAQWRGVADFLKAVDGTLVTSFAGSAGTRDARGVWQPAQMIALMRYSRDLGMPVAAASYMNEPNLVELTGAPKGYSAADYARDFDLFARTLRAEMPGAKVIGPDSVGGGGLERLAAEAKLTVLSNAEMMAKARERLDAVAYHHYGGLSERCATSGPLAVTPDTAFDPTWLARSDETLAYYLALRDAHAPGAPLWLTETAQAACGGSRWAARFEDVPRYLDQLGRLAAQGVQTVMHNTLAASDYGLLDEETFAPRPNYWAALLWSRLMGTTVLAAPAQPGASLRLYAHCLKGRSGGVALLAINLAAEGATLDFTGRGDLHLLEGEDQEARLNGTALALGPDDALPALHGRPVSGPRQLPPRSIAFLTLPDAANPACR